MDEKLLYEISKHYIYAYKENPAPQTLDICFSCYLTFVDKNWLVPRRLKDFIHHHIEQGNLTKDLTKTRGRKESIAEQQSICHLVFDYIADNITEINHDCFLIDDKSEYYMKEIEDINDKRLKSLNKIVEEVAKEMSKSVHAVYKCFKKHGSISWETYQWDCVRDPYGRRTNFIKDRSRLTPIQEQRINYICRSYIFWENEE